MSKHFKECKLPSEEIIKQKRCDLFISIFCVCRADGDDARDDDETQVGQRLGSERVVERIYLVIVGISAVSGHPDTLAIYAAAKGVVKGVEVLFGLVAEAASTFVLPLMPIGVCVTKQLTPALSKYFCTLYRDRRKAMRAPAIMRTRGGFLRWFSRIQFQSFSPRIGCDFKRFKMYKTLLSQAHSMRCASVYERFLPKK